MAKSPNWSLDELALLKEFYPLLGKCQELQDLFPTRPLQGICLKANRIGLKVLNNIREGRTNDEYIKLLENTNFIALETYKGSTVKILHKCKICNKEYLSRPQSVLRENAKCPDCSTSMNSIEYVDNTIHNSGLERLSEYLGSLHPITLKHTSCGYTWTTKFSYIQQGSGCPICNLGFGYSHSKENLPEKASLYIFKITLLDGTQFYKVGITCRDIKVRIRELKSDLKDILGSIEIIKEVVSKGIEILKLEKNILKSNRLIKYELGRRFDGSTELVDISTPIIDILKEYYE